WNSVPEVGDSSRLHLEHCLSYFPMPWQLLSWPHFLHLKSSPHFNDARYFTQLSSSGKRSWNSNKDRLLNRFSITFCLCYKVRVITLFRKSLVQSNYYNFLSKIFQIQNSMLLKNVYVP